MRIVFTLLLFFFVVEAFDQNLIYTPSSALEKTVEKNYYGTEYIFIRNNTNQSLELEFELISENIPSSWSVTGCTNLICYNYIPDKGTLGTKLTNEEWYMSLNISVNGQIGEGEVKFYVRSNDIATIGDTITFKIKVDESDLLEIKPWAQINYNQNGLTAFITNTAGATIYLFSVNGNAVIQESFESVITLGFNTLQTGIYVVVVRSKEGREFIQKINI